MVHDVHRHPRIFNTAFESGVRSLIILTSCYPAMLNLQRLVVLDHLVVHTGDVGGPPSLHPKVEFRAVEILVRRRVVNAGLALMGTRGLIERRATNEGFRYVAGSEAGAFIDLLSAEYSVRLANCAYWLSENIVPLDEQDFKSMVRSHLDEWLMEFHVEAGN